MFFQSSFSQRSYGFFDNIDCKHVTRWLSVSLRDNKYREHFFCSDTLSPQMIRSQKDYIKWTSRRNSKRTLSLDQMHTMCFHIHPAMTSIYISFGVPMTIIHSCLFFLSFLSYPTKNTLSLTLRTSLKASSEGLFHLLLKYWSARSTHTFIRRHTVRLTQDQSHWQSKPHFIQKEKVYMKVWW